ncbi:hypothetical protein [Pedobacter sp. GR22-6]|uniref:hypothetical protein n=1 Tax=Pedobacter sp. GR22-6 TaxID=3127957 RepID=UPI00307EF45B
MKILLMLSIFLAMLGLSSCSPDELLLVKSESFIVKNMDPLETPQVQVSKVTGATKTFSIFASNPSDSIAAFTSSEASANFEIAPLAFKMIDTRKPVSADAQGRLSRKLADVVFEFTVKIPNTFTEGEYSIKLNVTSGNGETKSIIVKLQASNFLTSINGGALYNGQVANSKKIYAVGATSFLYSVTTFSNVTDNTVNPPVVKSVPTAVAMAAAAVATAVTAANRPNIYGHIYTDLSDFEKRPMYLVSPNASWIADSLRVFNKFSGTYPTAQMRDVKYLDLGEIDFNSLKLSDLKNRQIGTAGEAKVQLIRGHGYAFLNKDGKIAVIYVKNILYTSPSYAGASPTAYVVHKLEE